MVRWKTGLVEANPIFEKNRIAAAIAERDLLETKYNLHLFITHTFEHSHDYQEGEGKYRDWWKFLAWHPQIKSHVDWIGWGDYQRSRYSDQSGKVVHFHSVAEIYKGLSGLLAKPDILGVSYWDIIRADLELSWEYGKCWIEPYEYGGNAIPYAINDHEHYYKGIGCPRLRHQCKRQRCSHGSPELEVNGRLQLINNIWQ